MRGRSSRIIVSVAVAGALALPALAGGATQPAAEVKAEGNAFSGGLKFDPDHVRVKVGQIVRWTNTDPVVPHTATEDHGLWRLTGTYGETPANPPGFGPGESRQRVFEAGTAHYFCEVHPQQMHGVVAVPVRLALKAGSPRHVVLRWASASAKAGQAFDVQVKRAGGEWKSFRTGTRKPGARFATHGPKVRYSVRARLRSASHPKQATGWSPVATISG